MFFLCRKENDKEGSPAPAAEEIDGDSDLVELEKAPPMSKAAGYWIQRRGDDRDGLVDTVNMKTGVMTVMYERDNGEVDEEEVPYAESGIKWLDDEEEDDADN
jgi:hypothetical protein